MTKSKLATGLVILASLFFAAPLVSYANSSSCDCSKCEHHKHHKHHSAAVCKEHCEHSKNKDCVADCTGKK